jgi:serine/threonine-protein kinase
MAHVTTPPPPLRDIPELSIPASVDELVLKCLAKNPADRPADAGQVAQAILTIRQQSDWTDDYSKGAITLLG